MYADSNGVNQETDVVVIGTGPAGLSAVAAAVEAGVKLVVVEAADCIGGNGIWSTGWVAFVDSELQRQNGIQDSEDKFIADCHKLVDEARSVYGIIFDEALARLYARESSKMYGILTSRGVKFPRLIKRPLQTSVPRLAAVEDTLMFAKAFEPEFAGPNVTTYLNTTTQQLIIEDGKVMGILAQPKRNGTSPFTVHARKGVILATGGYQANPMLRRRYQVDATSTYPYPGLDTCRGDGHLMGLGAKGDLINMTMIPPIVMVASALTDEAIAVNASKRRFHDEAGPYQYRVQQLQKQDQNIGHYIFDSNTARTKKRYVEQMPREVIQAATLAQLAAKINVPPSALEASVCEWNQFLASGACKDPVTGRVDFATNRRPIAEAPFYSSRMVPGISLTAGGFITTTSMQVVDVYGEPVPGLFAAGDCAGGFTPTAEMGGTHLGGGFVLGRVAGLAAAGKTDLARPHMETAFGRCLPSILEGRLERRLPIIDMQEGKGREREDSKL